MCKRCGNNPAIGTKEDREELGLASMLCQSCVRESVRKGLCPRCEYEMGSFAHKVRCEPVTDEDVEDAVLKEEAESMSAGGSAVVGATPDDADFDF